jgi:hypothetical protein
MSEKIELYDYCTNYVKQRIARIQAEIKSAQSSANEETKSSAGDKYETGRAMAQLEIERSQGQLKEAEKLEAVLNGIANSNLAERVLPGSLVITSKGIFYLAISLGLVKLHDTEYFLVSADSPIGKLLLNKKNGDHFNWNGSDYVIQAIK